MGIFALFESLEQSRLQQFCVIQFFPGTNLHVMQGIGVIERFFSAKPWPLKHENITLTFSGLWKKNPTDS